MGLFLSASKSEDPRLAVIEVGTAVEVALSRAVHDHLATLAEGARNQVITDAGGVVGLVRILEKLADASRSLWSNERWTSWPHHEIRLCRQGPKQRGAPQGIQDSHRTLLSTTRYQSHNAHRSLLAAPTGTFKGIRCRRLFPGLALAVRVITGGADEGSPGGVIRCQ